MNKYVLIALGCVSLAIGAVGTFLPILPGFPFLLLAAYLFGRSSERLENWFKSTKLYKNNLESYIKGEGMSVKAKVKIMITVTVLMGIGFYMMKQVLVGRIVLFIVWLFHILYFSFKVKTIKQED